MDEKDPAKEAIKEKLRRVWSLPKLETLDTSAPHHMCPGCGEPMAYRMIAEVMEELDLREDTIHVAGIGCYGALDGLLNVDRINALHGRAPPMATGVKRMLPDRFVITIQGDGDLISEGIAEAVHCAARGEKLTSASRL